MIALDILVSILILSLWIGGRSARKGLGHIESCLIRIESKMAEQSRSDAVVSAPSVTNSPLVHEILNDAGEVIDTVPHEHGITEPIKLALRTPSMAVRWAHTGVIEHGQE